MYHYCQYHILKKKLKQFFFLDILHVLQIQKGKKRKKQVNKHEQCGVIISRFLIQPFKFIKICFQIKIILNELYIT